MQDVNLSEQLEAHEDNHERHDFAKRVDAEAQAAERDDVIAFIERRVAFLNSRGQVGDTFRVDELYQIQRGIKAGRHTKREGNVNEREAT